MANLLRNRFGVKFDNSDLLTKNIYEFSFDLGSRIYSCQFYVFDDSASTTIDDAMGIRRFTLSVFDVNGETKFEKSFLSNRIITCSLDFEDNPDTSRYYAMLRVKGNF